MTVVSCQLTVVIRKREQAIKIINFFYIPNYNSQFPIPNSQFPIPKL
ncbi:hypothetical protein QUB52_12645 [Microcoleus sp. A6-C6]